MISPNLIFKWHLPSEPIPETIRNKVIDFADKGIRSIVISPDNPEFSRKYVQALREAVEISKQQSIDILIDDQTYINNNEIDDFLPENINLHQYCAVNKQININIPDGLILLAYMYDPNKPHNSRQNLMDSIQDNKITCRVPNNNYKAAIYVVERINDCKSFNLLNNEAVRFLFDSVQEEYREHISEYFGASFKGFITSTKYINNLSWDSSIQKYMNDAIGMETSGFLPHLFFEIDEKTQTIRQIYKEGIYNKLEKSFVNPYTEWCNLNKLQVLFDTETLNMDSSFNALSFIDIIKKNVGSKLQINYLSSPGSTYALDKQLYWPFIKDITCENNLDFYIKSAKPLLALHTEWVFKTLNDNNYPLKEYETTFTQKGITYKTDFTCATLPASIFLNIENTKSVFEIEINGQHTIISEILDISKLLQIGKNVITITTYPCTPLLTPLSISGRFCVWDNAISEEIKAAMLGSWVDYGYANYSGTVEYSQTFKCPRFDKKKQSVLLFLEEVYDFAEVIINNRSQGKRFAKPWIWDVTDILQSGRNIIDIRITNSISNKLYNTKLKSGIIGNAIFLIKDKK